MNPDASLQNTELKILYFARLGEQLNCREEFLQLPEGVVTAGQLREFLTSRDPRWSALADTRIRTAVNQDVASLDVVIKPGDEVAFFPPVTGG